MTSADEGQPLPMNQRNDRTLIPSHPSGEGLPYSQGRVLFTSIVEIGVFFKLQVLQIASVNCKVVPKTAKFPIYSRLSANFPISREWKSVSRLFAIFLLSNFVDYHCILLARSQHCMRARQIYYYTATIWLDFNSESLLN